MDLRKIAIHRKQVQEAVSAAKGHGVVCNKSEYSGLENYDPYGLRELLEVTRPRAQNDTSVRSKFVGVDKEIEQIEQFFSDVKQASDRVKSHIFNIIRASWRRARIHSSITMSVVQKDRDHPIELIQH